MMDSQLIGSIPCPVCGFVATLKETKKGKAYVTCGECGSQTFARGAVADIALRVKAKEIHTDPRPAVEATDPPIETDPPKPPAATVRRHSADTGETEETIFDLAGKWLRS